MVVRPIDENGDMMPIQNSGQMIEGAPAVAQIAKERLLFYRGDWWEDESLGIRIPEFLASTVRKSDVSLFVKYITSYLGGTKGVTGVTNVNVTFEKNVLMYRALLLTDDGSAGLEANLSGLL